MDWSSYFLHPLNAFLQTESLSFTSLSLSLSINPDVDSPLLQSLRAGMKVFKLDQMLQFVGNFSFVMFTFTLQHRKKYNSFQWFFCRLMFHLNSVMILEQFSIPAERFWLRDMSQAERIFESHLVRFEMSLTPWKKLVNLSSFSEIILSNLDIFRCEVETETTICVDQRGPIWKKHTDLPHLLLWNYIFRHRLGSSSPALTCHQRRPQGCSRSRSDFHSYSPSVLELLAMINEIN